MAIVACSMSDFQMVTTYKDKKLTGFAWSEEVLAGGGKKCRTMPKS
jgi:hypothetical protein